jgi:release factor H-coupled RctB family protein
MTSPTVRVIASPTSWIEGEAVRQLERTAALPGMKLAVGLPDLHAGKGHPIGAVLGTEGVIYPFLVGSDIGCGMALSSIDLPSRKLKRDRWTSKLDLEGPIDDRDLAPLLAESDLFPGAHDASLGTIGGGNHFAELQALDEVLDPEGVAALGIDREKLLLLVHSGSRGLGESILRRHTEVHGDGSLDLGGAEARHYLEQHDAAVRWAKLNRRLIGERFAEALGTTIDPRIDLVHNAVVPGVGAEGEPLWLHRKGASPADQGVVVIPGSRGHMSYLVRPTNEGAASGFSLAHGAGRKWTRSDARARLKPRFRPADLVRTALGSDVICDNRDLLYEEAPEAYKAIDRVVLDLVEHGLCQVLATLRPIITYKTRGEQCDD